MLKADKRNALHKSIMLRVLINILDDTFLSKNLYFKGGTCASMLGYLERFSVDLDFDLKDLDSRSQITEKLEALFKNLDFEIKEYSKNVIQYYLKYDAPESLRNTLKVEAIDIPFKNNKYETILLPEINRYAICQTKETLFSNKLVALIDRYEKNNSLAGRDLYDIHHFFQNGFEYNNELIKERRKTEVKVFFLELIDFIENKITETIINQDLNMLLEYKEFNAVRKTLKDETLAFLRAEAA
jgi:predicted nucleotidyltransferase component of viral defense system